MTSLADRAKSQQSWYLTKCELKHHFELIIRHHGLTEEISSSNKPSISSICKAEPKKVVRECANNKTQNDLWKDRCVRFCLHRAYLNQNKPKNNQENESGSKQSPNRVYLIGYNWKLRVESLSIVCAILIVCRLTAFRGHFLITRLVWLVHTWRAIVGGWVYGICNCCVCWRQVTGAV
jgi:hypothetical protein